MSAKIIAVLPAHNEAACIEESIRALQAQTLRPDRIIVVCDNCTDNTEELATLAGAETFVTSNNTGKKAGALNQVLAHLLPRLRLDDLVFIQDADTTVVPEFLEVARNAVIGDPRVLVSGRYACTPQHGFLNHCRSWKPGMIELVQSNEFTRDGLKIDRRGKFTHIMVGIGAMYPARALSHVVQARADGTLPPGYVYVEDSITEDFELTLAVKHLGYVTVSPRECRAFTELMPTLPKLWHQRIRWMRGGVEDMRRYGLTPVVRGFLGRQLWIMFGLASLLTYLAAVFTTLAINGSVEFAWVWCLVTVIFFLDRVVAVRRAGPMAMCVAALMIPEMIYDSFAQVVYLTAVTKALRGSEAQWVET